MPAGSEVAWQGEGQGVVCREEELFGSECMVGGKKKRVK